MNRIILALVAGAAALAACATQVAVESRVPAKYEAAASLRRVAVLEFDGRQGEEFGTILQAELQSAALDGRTFFSVVSPEELISRAGLRSFSSRPAELQAVLMTARNAAVQGIYYGEIIGRDIDSQRNSGDNYTCYNYTAKVDVVPKLLNTNSGAIVYSEPVTGYAYDGYCTGGSRKYSNNQLYTMAMQNAAVRIRRAVAPYNTMVNVDLKRDGKGLRGDAKDRFKGAVEFAEAGRLDRACGIWQELDLESPQSLDLTYNLGVCAEYDGDIDRAIALYSKADAMLDRPDNMVNEALERVRSTRTNERLVERQAG